MIEACIFDIGGVLIRTNIALCNAIKQVLETNSLRVPPDSEMAKYLGTGGRNILKSTLASFYTGNDFDSVFEKCYAELKVIFPEKVLGSLELISGAERCLKELSLRRMKLACQTAATKKDAVIILKNFNLLGYFPVLVTYDDVKKIRPDPEAMYLTMKKLGITDKSRCLYIGDSITDIRFARNAGVKIACVTTGGQPKEILVKEKPDYIINNLPELLNLV
ncbi:HAD family hydrolase [Candidatus Micrarchaeota archaeon]|nr:HAD family hydrolase [Candidatus Micrarchaeota archaeon]